MTGRWTVDLTTKNEFKSSSLEPRRSWMDTSDGSHKSPRSQTPEVSGSRSDDHSHPSCCAGFRQNKPLLQASRFPIIPHNPSTLQSSMFLYRDRLGRALSAFDHARHRWVAIPLRDPHDHVAQRSSSRPADAFPYILEYPGLPVKARRTLRTHPRPRPQRTRVSRHYSSSRA